MRIETYVIPVSSISDTVVLWEGVLRVSLVSIVASPLYTEYYMQLQLKRFSGIKFLEELNRRMVLHFIEFRTFFIRSNLKYFQFEFGDLG